MVTQYIKMFSSLSRVRLVFWTFPYSNILCVSLEKLSTTTTSSFLIPEDWKPETPTQQIAIVLCLLPCGCSPLLTYPTSPGYRRSSAFWVDLCGQSVLFYCSTILLDDSHKSVWSIIHCCWTASLEQPASSPTWFSTDSLDVPPLAKDAPVWWGQRHPMTVVIARLINALTYLLTTRAVFDGGSGSLTPARGSWPPESSA